MYILDSLLNDVQKGIDPVGSLYISCCVQTTIMTAKTTATTLVTRVTTTTAKTKIPTTTKIKDDNDNTGAKSKMRWDSLFLTEHMGNAKCVIGIIYFTITTSFLGGNIHSNIARRAQCDNKVSKIVKNNLKDRCFLRKVSTSHKYFSFITQSISSIWLRRFIYPTLLYAKLFRLLFHPLENY